MCVRERVRVCVGGVRASPSRHPQVDSSEQEPQYLPTMAPELEELPERRSVYGRYAEEYEDAPISQTLPASIRIGTCYVGLL